MRFTLNPTNFEPGTRWINPGHVLGALLLLVLVGLIIVALI